MKTKTVVVTSAFLMFAAIPVFAQTHQEELICLLTAGNCLQEEQTQNEPTRVSSSSPEDTETIEQRQEDFRLRLQGVAVFRGGKQAGESSSPESMETPEQYQNDLKERLQGHEPRPHI